MSFFVTESVILVIIILLFFNLLKNFSLFFFDFGITLVCFWSLRPKINLRLSLSCNSNFLDLVGTSIFS